MAKTQIAYAVVANPNNLFLQELWVSVYSLRLYEPDREVRVCCDKTTASYIQSFPELVKLITEVVIIPVPEHYTNKERSREIKTSVRKHIIGNYLFVDTDTVFTGNLKEIDTFSFDIAAVPEFHVSLKKSMFRDNILGTIRKIFSEDVSDAEIWFNSGVMYVADTPSTHQFYEQWNTNWHFSTFERGNSQDQPALIKTDKGLGYLIRELPGEYNCQLCMSARYFAEAKIIHFLHFNLLPELQNPFYNKRIYQQIKEDGGITQETKEIIIHCKSLIDTVSCIVEGQTMRFLLSNPGHVFLSIYEKGGWKLSLMNKIAGLIQRIMK